MKKFYAFFAAALISVCAFASKDVVPSDAVLADYYDAGNVCVCFFVPADMACNDIIVTGSFNGWSTDLSKCPIAEAVEGYDGWYVASFEPEAEPDATKGIQAKPIMLDGEGKFNWEYQVGAATAIRGGVQVVQGDYAGEVDLINYGADAPNVFTVDAWKQNPCEAVYHNYVITVVSDGCDGFVVPFIQGTINNWGGWIQMQYSPEKSAQHDGIPTYTHSFKGPEGSKYQIVSGLMTSEGEIDSTAAPGWYDDAYIQELVGEDWERVNGGNDIATGEEAEILWDLSVDTLRWARCAPPEPLETVAFSVKLPAENLPEEGVEVIGTFDEWAGTSLAFNGSTGYFEATLEAKASQFFKFRSAGAWPPAGQEIELYVAEGEEADTWHKIGDGELKFGKLWEGAEGNRTLTLDLSENARWTEKTEGIEEIKLTKEVKKVVVDGAVYVVRDGKLFNILGAQVR